MGVSATSVAAATAMLATVVAVFLAFVLGFYLFLCAKRYRGAAPTLGSAPRGGTDGGWCHDGGLSEAAIAALPSAEAGEGLDCAVCLSEVAAGEAARMLPRCGHGFHVECVDMWLRSHSTCPLCRCPVIDDDEAFDERMRRGVQAPEADPESPVFPTNVLFFGSQDDVSTGGAGGGPAVADQAVALDDVRSPAPAQAQSPSPLRTLRRLLVRGGRVAVPQCNPRADVDVEQGLGGAESSTSPAAAKTQAGS